MTDLLHALAGIAGLLALAWAASENRRAVPWRAIAAGMGLLVFLAVLFLKIPLFKAVFLKINDALLLLEQATQAGTSLVFGFLGGGPAPFAVTDGNATFILAFRALPLVLVISALSALLFHWRVLPAIVRGISFRPYLARVSRGELFAIMVGGMASIAGTVLFLYAAILRSVLPDAVAHLLIASILSAPAALVIAFLMVPPQGKATGGSIELKDEAAGSMDALTRGTLEGVQLLLNIVAMLIVFVALVALANLIIAPYTLQGMLGWALAPLAWLAGIPWAEAPAAGALLGSKTVINELVAYLELARMTEISERSRLLLTYALCGFANFGSLGIMIGGLGTMCPPRRGEIVALGIKSIVAGTLATCLTAASVGLIL